MTSLSCSHARADWPRAVPVTCCPHVHHFFSISKRQAGSLECQAHKSASGAQSCRAGTAAFARLCCNRYMMSSEMSQSWSASDAALAGLAGASGSTGASGFNGSTGAQGAQTGHDWLPQCFRLMTVRDGAAPLYQLPQSCTELSCWPPPLHDHALHIR